MDYLQHKKQIWDLCNQKGKKLINMGLEFFKDHGPERYYGTKILREELAVNARYLHRGYYCPSPVWDKILENSRRGKVLIRPTSRSRISHRYLYGPDDKLMIVEATLPDGKKKREYLVYENNVVYGLAYDEWGTLVGISEEVYKQDMILSYFCASCYNHLTDGFDFGITSAHYEKYYYEGHKIHEADCYYTQFWWDEDVDFWTELDRFICGGRYGFEWDNGTIVKFYCVD